MDIHSKNVSIMFDEMDIQNKYSYNARLKLSMPPAKKMVVFMIRGLILGYKQIVYYNFDTPITKDFLLEVIRRVEETGLYTRCVAMDMGNQQVCSIKYIFTLNSNL